jgi:CdiI N-terminal domain
MTFCIKVLNSISIDGGTPVGEIALGEHLETFPLLITRWSIDEYVRQWWLAAEAIAHGTVQRCMFVTDIQPIEVSAGLSYWVLFRTQEGLVAQERFMRVVPDVDLFSPLETELVIPPRFLGNPEEDALVSEWEISLDELHQFVAMFSGA